MVFSHLYHPDCTKTASLSWGCILGVAYGSRGGKRSPYFKDRRKGEELLIAGVQLMSRQVVTFSQCPPKWLEQQRTAVDVYIVCFSSVHGHELSSHQMSPTKHKFEDKISGNFKMVKTEHQTKCPAGGTGTFRALDPVRLHRLHTHKTGLVKELDPLL